MARIGAQYRFFSESGVTEPGKSTNGETPRLLGAHDGSAGGPTMVVFGGIHGNEPAGTVAFRRVLLILQDTGIEVRGRLVGIAGNLEAMNRNRRFVDSDLNRGWSDLHVEVSEQRPETSEDSERAGIVAAIRKHAPAGQRVTFLDLHSTSGAGPAFACMSDVVRNRRVAFAMGVPVILGLEEVLDGTLVGWLTGRGHVAVAIEGGPHDAAETVDRHESAIWIALAAAGMVNPEDVPGGCDSHQHALREAAQGIPGILEIRHRHGLNGGEEFVMKPGFANFSPLAKGQVVALDGEAEIRTPVSGMMMLPRYQREGDDGYFVVAPVSRFWLHFSVLLRRTFLHRLLPLLPGVRSAGENRWSVDRRVARFLVVELFHLFGYRRMKSGDESRFLFGRRRPDSQPPLPI